MTEKREMNLLGEINSILAKHENVKKVVEKKKEKEIEEPKNLPSIRNFLNNRTVLNNVLVEYGKFETKIRIE